MTRSLQLVFVLGYLLPGLPPLGIARHFGQPLRAILASVGSSWLLLPGAAIIVTHLCAGSFPWGHMSGDKAAKQLAVLDRRALAIASVMGICLGVWLSTR
ncbi:MAG: hypothetical protein WCD35_13140 [Mycobacteriales bacterium]